MRKLGFIFIILINHFLLFNCFGQQKFSLNLGAQSGNSRLKFEGLQLENLKPLFNQNSLFCGIQYRIGKSFELGLDIIDQQNKWKFTDNQTITLSNGDYVKLLSESGVHFQAISYHLGFLFPFKKNDKLQLLLASGYNFGQVKPIKGASNFGYMPSEISIIQSNSIEKYSSIFFKTGINLNISKWIDFGINCGFNYSLQPIFNCKYSINTNGYSGNSIITSTGSAAYFGTSLSVALFRIKKREKKLVKYSPQFNDKNEITAIDEREVITNFEIHVESDKIEIQLWDYGKEDGDKISLFLDNEQLLKKYILTSKRKKLTLNLKPGTNKLIIYAHNLGKDPPNTASVVVDDGHKKHLLSLQSTLGECGSISIIYNP